MCWRRGRGGRGWGGGGGGGERLGLLRGWAAGLADGAAARWVSLTREGPGFARSREELWQGLVWAGGGGGVGAGGGGVAGGGEWGLGQFPAGYGFWLDPGQSRRAVGLGLLAGVVYRGGDEGRDAGAVRRL